MRKNECMINILDTLKVNIQVKDFHDPVIGIATLNFNKQLEVRFCPIMWRKDRTAIFFTTPSLVAWNHKKCAVILDSDEYKKVGEIVISKFLELAREKFDMFEVKEIESAIKNNIKQEIEEINLDDIQL